MNPSSTGWWTPGDALPVSDGTGIRQALMMLNHPIYILDVHGKISAAHGGNAWFVSGTGPAAPPFAPPGDVFPVKAFAPPLRLEALGDTGFKRRHHLKYPYVAGAMANGITSVSMVKAMAENQMMGFFGAGGLSLSEVESALMALKTLPKGQTFGCNLIHSPGDPELEMNLVRLCLEHGVRRISAAAFMRITLPLVYFRIKGIHRNALGEVVTPNHIMAKVSRVEVARQFFAPPPEKMVRELVAAGLITDGEAQLSRAIPMAQDLTAEADSGGHTDNRPAIALFPIMVALKDAFNDRYQYPAPLCVGFAGGISTPESAAAAFHMGAAYILTGSVNQSCVEAGTSREVKTLLARAEQADVAMAPSADMFEIGARVQVLKRGTLFSVRAEKLYQIYKHHDSFDQVPPALRKEVEEKLLQDSFEAAWERTRGFFARRNIQEVERAEKDPRHQMALVFRSYLGRASRWSISGAPERKMDYQIWCGPAMGAFNHWVQGSCLEAPENRHVALVALNLLFGAAVCTRAAWLKNQCRELPPDVARFSPMERAAIVKFL